MDMNRIQLSDSEPKDNGPKNKCHQCKVSNTTSLVFFKKMTLEFTTPKEKNANNLEFIKCKICGETFRQTVKLVVQAINKHKGQQKLENKFNIKTCILKHSSNSS